MKRFTLPSGRVVTVSGEPKQVRRGKAAPLFSEVKEVWPEAPSLELRDFHALRAILTRLDYLAEDPIEISCRNCDHAFEVSPCAALPLAPFEDAELDDPELDATLPLGAHEVPELGKITFRAITARDAEPLFRALRRRRLVLTPAVVRAMGIDADAKALTECSDDAFQTVCDLFLDIHYPPRLFSLALCPKCGARNDVDAPYEREFMRGSNRESNEESFPSFEEFDRAAHELFSRQNAREVVFVVEGGVPACDDGGEPLLGSYVPHAGAPEVTVFYRTFRAMWQEDGPYDWRAELQETIEHELEHHGAFLTGHDAMDDEERAEIAHEARVILGKKAALRGEVKTLGSSFSDFMKRTWPIWVILLVVTIFLTLYRH